MVDVATKQIVKYSFFIFSPHQKKWVSKVREDLKINVSMLKIKKFKYRGKNDSKLSHIYMFINIIILGFYATFSKILLNFLD